MARAVSTMVSVPCVMTICSSSHSRHARTIMRALLVGHLEAVDHHQRLDVDIQPASPAPQHLVDVRVSEVEPAGELVVFLVERAAGDEDANGHGGRERLVVTRSLCERQTIPFEVEHLELAESPRLAHGPPCTFAPRGRSSA